MRRMTNLIAAAALALAIPAAMPAAAQQLIGAYTAFIGTDDLYNSSGARLTQPWQVLRQDRANYHRFGIRHAGDEWDPFFGSIENRAAMERMIMNGSMDPIARQNLLQGGATVFVRIYGAGGVGRYVDVTVAR
ncbi:hypothetical protein RIdsm_03372 [Roseovarius indicus]|uniref:Uncharacterized protein n=3 Tax=Roseovarius indicus TaxID=540747 RepID=A0A0T5P808_9RHOB|nr:hypothetical protein XM52_13965 [Roseovarius indicus]OAO08926.1 hypothetical protein A8B76_26455 [Roseovarius indicus]QEW27556.1 hypothetical protein RIdsm_03372 [Roseovarius indicus]SFE35863.1 hypothetical protein SAMN04488031_108224 [Roseovarius indicus]